MKHLNPQYGITAFSGIPTCPGADLSPRIDEGTGVNKEFA